MVIFTIIIKTIIDAYSESSSMISIEIASWIILSNASENQIVSEKKSLDTVYFPYWNYFWTITMITPINLKQYPTSVTILSFSRPLKELSFR